MPFHNTLQPLSTVVTHTNEYFPRYAHTISVDMTMYDIDSDFDEERET